MQAPKPLLRRVLTAAIFLLIFSSVVLAQDPFRSSHQSQGPVIYQGNLPEFFLTWTRNLQAQITAYNRRLQNGESLLTLIPAFLVALVFGMLHVLGPGHGKLFTISYMGSRKANIGEGIALSAVINIVDSLSAAGLVFIGYGVLRLSTGEIQGDLSRIIQIISYSLIIIFSAVHIFSHLLPGHHHHHHHGHDHHHDHHHDHDEIHDHSHASHDDHSHRPLSRHPALLALSIGLIPCPVSSVLLLYGIANAVVPFSILMVAAVSFGGFITMSILTIAVITGRKELIDKHVSGGKAAEIVEMVGLILMILVAAILLAAQIW